MTQDQEFLCALLKNVPLSEMSEDALEKWIHNPLILRKALRLALIPSHNTPELKAWKAIKLGVGPRNEYDFRRYMKAARIKIDDTAKDVMSKREFTISAEEREVDLVVVSVADLGFKKGARRGRIYQRARSLGLELCPPDVGPQLRLQYRDQPRDELLLIGMEPITHSNGLPRVFYVYRDDFGLRLGSRLEIPDIGWFPEHRCVFVRPRK